MEQTRRNLWVLAACQGLLLTNNTVLVTINGLAGLALAPDKALATLPVTTYYLGSALSTVPVSFLMKRYGRRAGFITGAACAILGSLLSAAAIFIASFLLLCAGTFVLGVYFASGQYYRFAAADAAPLDFRSKAIALVLAGGILGGFIGPETSKITLGAIPDHLYAGPFFSLVIFALLAIATLRWLDLAPLSETARRDAGRPLLQIARQPAFLVAALTGMVSYGVMNLLMTATPLAMFACEHPFSAAAFVIQWHVLGMFAPSFFTGSLIQRYGLLRIMLLGVVLNVASVAVAMADAEVFNFWLSMFLLGVGWNFMYVGATALLTETHTPAERAKTQGANDMAIFVTMVVSSLSAGALFSYQGWQTMNMLAIPALLLSAGGIIWLARLRKHAAGQG